MEKVDAICDILVVGGGPTGITLALVAARHGAHVVVCERESDIYPLPRAAHVDHEVMRIFQAVGAADAIAATSRTTSHYDFLTADGEILMRFNGSDKIGQGGWPAANMIHQPSVERALRQRLAELPNTELRSGWQYLNHEDEVECIIARFSTRNGERRIRAKYIVGADGTRSTVRNNARIPLDDLGFDEPWLVVDTIVHDASRLPSINLQICDPARPTTCVLMGEGRHRWEFMLLPGETPDQVLEDNFIESLLAPWNVDGAVTLERKAVYTFNARVATTWRQGRLLLAGDAAHQTPPFAGQGMCAGIRDAANLGWKLAAIIGGHASEQILDSYQIEREPHARATIDLAILMGRTVCVTDQTKAQERDAQMLAARRAGKGPSGPVAFPPLGAGLIASDTAGAGSYFPQFRKSGGRDDSRIDDILGPGPWLISQSFVSNVGEANIRMISIEHPALHPYASDILDWLDKHLASAVLVRPDHVVFGTGEPAFLKSAWQKALQKSSS